MHDLELSFAMSAAGEPDPRAIIDTIARMGYRAIQLDGTMPGLRARELDRSGRRDVAALLRRLGLRFSGIDLLIPPAEFVDPGRGERALAAAIAAMDLAAELSRLVESMHPAVCVELPPELGLEAQGALRARSASLGVRVADLRWPTRAVSGPEEPLAAGIDPARVLLAGEDPAAAVSRMGLSLACARLSDTDGTGRVAPLAPGGRLDGLSYRVALGTSGYRGAVVADLRGVRRWEAAAPGVRAAWRAV